MLVTSEGSLPHHPPGKSRAGHRGIHPGGVGQRQAIRLPHGKPTVSLAVPTQEIEAAVRHGSRLVTLAGAVAQKALIRDLQWDTWGAKVLHVDFARISEDERVEVTVIMWLFLGSNL